MSLTGVEPVRPVAVVVSKQRITGAVNGSSAYLIALARTIKKAGYDIHLIQPSPTIAGRTPFLRLLPEMAVFDRHASRRGQRFGKFVLFADPRIIASALKGTLQRTARRLGMSGAWTVDRPRPYAVATPWTEADMIFLRRNIPANTKLVIADYVFCTPAFAAKPEGVSTMIVMHDLFHARDGKGKDSVAAIGKAEEISKLARADAVIAIQSAERDFVTHEVPGSRSILAPMPAQPIQNPQPGRPDLLLFVGSNTAPNVVGLQWFIDDIWPTIARLNPAVQLDVVGTVNRGLETVADPRIRLHGIVDDLQQFYSKAAVVVSPLTFGSGLKIKLIEALAQGKAMVVTGVTLQGVEDICGPAVERAEKPDDFAQAVIGLMTSEPQRLALSKKALACAHANFTAETAHEDLREWLRENLR